MDVQDYNRKVMDSNIVMKYLHCILCYQ